VARQMMRRSLGWGPQEPVVGFSGRFVEEKGIGTLIDAFTQSGASWNLLFVGGGAMAPLIDTLRLRHPSRVRIVTGVPHDEMPACLNAMDLLCAPSRTTPRWREQFGRMLIEAMACGIPVLASPSGEIPYVVGDTGVLVAEDDAAAWRREIERLLGDETVRAGMSARALERVHQRFTWRQAARAHLAFFAGICER